MKPLKCKATLLNTFKNLEVTSKTLNDLGNKLKVNETCCSKSKMCQNSYNTETKKQNYTALPKILRGLLELKLLCEQVDAEVDTSFTMLAHVLHFITFSGRMYSLLSYLHPPAGFINYTDLQT